MKKYVLSALLSSSLALFVACGDGEGSRNNADNNVDTEGNAPVSAEESEESEVTTDSSDAQEDEEVTNDFEEYPEDGVLTEIGQKVETEHYAFELVAINDEVHTIETGPITFTVDSVKVFKAEASDDYFENVLSTVFDSPHYFQIQFSGVAVNNEDETMNFYPITQVITTTTDGESRQIEAEYQINSSDLNGHIHGGVTIEDHISFVTDADLSEIESIRTLGGAPYSSEYSEEGWEAPELNIEF